MRLKPIFIFNCKGVYEQQPVATQLKNTIVRAEFINLYNIFVMYLNNKYKYSHPYIIPTMSSNGTPVGVCLETYRS